MRISDERYDRDLRRYQLARRFIRHEARTQTVCTWTGLTDERVRSFYRTYTPSAYTSGNGGCTGAATRHRGPSPRRLASVMRSVALRTEGAAAAGIARAVGVTPTPSLASGERLCLAYELFRELIPDAQLTLEQLLLLVTALTRGEFVELSTCDHCSAAILMDRLALPRRVCAHCRRSGPQVLEQEPQTRATPAGEAGAGGQGSLF